MKKQSPTTDLKQLRLLSDSIGDFIRYWGFRRIHGALWTQLYLSPKALSGAQLVTRLKVSKALVCPALQELETWGLLLPVQTTNAKTKYYKADPDVFKVIRKVLAQREKHMINQVDKNLSLLKTHSNTETIDQDRLFQLEGMIQSAQTGLQMLLLMDNITDFESTLSSLK